MKRTTAVSMIVALLCAASPVRAHYLWVDPAGGPTVRFGEFEEGVVEKSPGRLDEMVETKVAVADRIVSTSLAADRITIAGAAVAQSVTAENLSVPVKDWRSSGLGMVKPFYYARWGTGGRPMMLDILPNSPSTATVVFKGQPLPKAKILVHAPNGWTREETADERGEVRFSTPWSGLYVLEVVHSEEGPGTYAGAAFESQRHRATLAVVQSGGPAVTAPVSNPHHH
jgi:hypothetical protein